MSTQQENDLRRRPTGELLKQLSDHTTTLVKQEIELAKAELGEKGKQAGMGAGMFGAAGLFGALALAALTTCIVAALDTAVDLWLAALIVAVAYAAIAAVLGLQGRSRMQEAGPPVPEQAKQSVKEDLEWARTQAQSGRT